MELRLPSKETILCGGLAARPRKQALPSSLRVGVSIFAAAAILSLIGALFLANPNEQQLEASYAPPGASGHLLGTDPLGRDILSWIAASIRTAAEIGIGVVVLSSAIGVLIGLLSGYFGGAMDAVLMRLVDLQLAIPPLLLFISAAAVLGTDKLTLILLLSMASWVPYARVVRTQVQLESERASVTAARLAGVSTSRIMLRHLMPAVAGTIVILASLQLGFVLLWESALSFVGLGINPPSQSLGFLIAEGRDSLAEAWWLVVFPGLTLVLLVLAANLVGDGLRDRLDINPDVFDR